MDNIPDQIKEVVEMGLEIAVVIGGGNFWRGVSASANGMDRTTADYIGMLATVMNAVGLQNSLERMGISQECNLQYQCSKSQNLLSGEEQ